MIDDALGGDAPLEYLGQHREALVERTLDLLSADTSNPPGDTREAST